MTSRWPLTALALFVAVADATPLFAQRPRRPGVAGPAEEGEPPAKPLLRGLQPKVYAITGARVVTEPGKVIEGGTVVVRDGVIEAVGAGATVPADAVKVDGAKLTVYAGFIDAGSAWGFDPAIRRSETGPAAPEDLASETLTATKPDNRKGLTPEFLVSAALKTDDAAADAWRRAGFTTRLVAPEGGIFTGQSALVNLNEAITRDSVVRSPVALHGALKPVPGGTDYPRVLMGTIAHARQTLLDAGFYQRNQVYFDTNGRRGKRPPLDPCLAALGPALEGKVRVAFEADGRDTIHRALDFAAEFNLRPIIVGGREAYKLADRLQKDEVPVVLRLSNYEPNERDAELPPRVREDRKAKRDAEAENAAKLRKAGVRVLLAARALPTERFGEKFAEAVKPLLKGGLSADDALRAMTTEPAKLFDVEGQAGSIAPGKAANLVLMDGAFGDEKAKVRHVFVDGRKFDFTAPPAEPTPTARTGTRTGEKSAEKPESNKPFIGPRTEEDTFAELESDRAPKLRTGGNVLLKNGVFLTLAPFQAGPVKGDLLITKGKIAAIGSDIALPADHTVTDLHGCYAMPGIIDTHCHFAIAGGVNEFSLSVVPECRIRDVIEGDSVQIYRGLAGGVTTARLLHGSANCIGGQDAVIKMKYGQPARNLVVTDRPRGVKFALGENVKRTDGRFPNTRLGVEAVMVRAFSEAEEYRRVWADYAADRSAGKAPPEPRRDLRLEALADVLRGDLEVHSHCYRSDEILMLLRVCDRFGVKIKSLQHVLEGYKIAPEIAAHGASVSLFADWWAYKIEAFDAIPYAGALMNKAGVTVCLKSDDNELMRHMYQEAAKLVKYGDMFEVDALRAITANGAKQLGIAHRVGTLEVGKDGDVAIFNGHPLNGYSAVQMTIVEGEVYFQRQEQLSAISTEPLPTRPTSKFTPPPADSDLFAINNCTVHPVTSKPLDSVTVGIQGGKINSIGDHERRSLIDVDGAITPLSARFKHIDGTGLHLYPGLIDAATVLGLSELESARETADFSEGGDFQPDLRASVGVNPDSELIPVTRSNGVLSVVTRPTGGLISGQGALINLAGWTPRQMTVADPLALHVEFPARLPPTQADGAPFPFARGIQKKQRDEKLRRLKALFAQAKLYDEAKRAGQKPTADPRLEAMVPYATGQKPVVVQAQRKAEIEEAVALADELKIKIILSGAEDAWKVAGLLKSKNVPVIAGPVMALPLANEDAYDAPMTNPARLHAAGVPFCIRSIGGSNVRNLPYEAAMAASYGLSPQAALEAVTINPARILGVADQLGSIEVGKRANLVLTDGDILQPTTRVLGLWIDGKFIEPTNKQTRLYERYSQRLEEVKKGIAPLGTK